MKKIIRFILNIIMKLFITNNDNGIYKKINKFDYVSFDMFDTLIKRNILKENDIFKIVEKKYNEKFSKKINFYQDRILAEKNARSHSKYCEVTIDDIYEYLNYSKEEKDILKDFEKNIEIEMCIENKRLKKIYDKCKANNKKIFITSDMYLDENTIKRILDKCGYKDYECLYLSSKERKQKKNYELFNKILYDYKITKKQIIHVGDNCVSDYLIPMYHGIKAILIKKDIYKINKLNKKSIKNNIYYNYLTMLANNLMTDKRDLIDTISYPILSEIICSYCISLKKYTKKNKIDKIYFLARDAKIILDSYKILYPEDQNKIEYMYVSRKAMLYPGMNICSNIKEFESILETILGREFTNSKIFELFNIKINEHNSMNKITDKTFKKCDEIEKKKIFEFIKNIKKDEFEQQSNTFKEYLEQLNFANNICLVDIGWRGSIQNIISGFCNYNKIDVNIYGYYLGLLNKTITPASGLLFDLTRKENYEINKIILSISFFETMFLNTDGSTIAYKKSKEKIIPLKKEKDNSKAVEDIFNKIHSNVIEYMKKINGELAYNLFNSNNYDYMYNYEKLIVSPNNKTINFIKQIHFDDNGNKKIINNKNLFYYLFNIKKIKCDFLECKYKIGFLKNLLKIPLNYYKLLNIIKMKVSDK